MDINLVQSGTPMFGSAVPEAVLPQMGRGVGQPAEIKQLPQQQAKNNEAQFNTSAADQARQAYVEMAAERMALDIYAVGDAKFSIYKDLSGQFVTRFTSLRDGAVTYFPEQDMNMYMESRGTRRKALLQLDV